MGACSFYIACTLVLLMLFVSPYNLKHSRKGMRIEPRIVFVLSFQNSVIAHIVDLSQPREVFNFAKSFAESHGILHVLVRQRGSSCVCNPCSCYTTAFSWLLQFVIPPPPQPNHSFHLKNTGILTGQTRGKGNN